ncbi:MAG: hypothetical protein OXU20_27670 [Myxococcales bacterium]|nr:hypothetical protein [Myxococcales bacterium]
MGFVDPRRKLWAFAPRGEAADSARIVIRLACFVERVGEARVPKPGTASVPVMVAQVIGFARVLVSGGNASPHPARALVMDAG